MSRILVIDTECTDKDEDRQVIELAWLTVDAPPDIVRPADRIPRPLIWDGSDLQVQRYRPSRPISFGAMAVHHILPNELEDCPPHTEAKLPAGVEYVIGHNVDFDWQALGSPPVKRICTDALARYVWPNADSYSQSALLYMLLGPNDRTRTRLKDAHDAGVDVVNCTKLLEAVIAATGIETWSDLYDYSEKCRIPLKMPFGKHEGVELAQLPHVDYGYVSWLLKQDWLDTYLRQGLEIALQRPARPKDATG